MTGPQQLAWPLQVETVDGVTRLREVEQGSQEEIRGSLALLCLLRVDQLPWAEDLGIPDPLGTVDPEAAAMEIEAALREMDPRVPVTVTVVDDPARGRTLRLQLGVDPDDLEDQFDG